MKYWLLDVRVKDMGTPRGMDVLPEQCLDIVLRGLGAKDMRTCSTVCRSWRNVILRQRRDDVLTALRAALFRRNHQFRMWAPVRCAWLATYRHGMRRTVRQLVHRALLPLLALELALTRFQGSSILLAYMLLDNNRGVVLHAGRDSQGLSVHVEALLERVRAFCCDCMLFPVMPLSIARAGSQTIISITGDALLVALAYHAPSAQAVLPLLLQG